jgi:hypothetical protein
VSKDEVAAVREAGLSLRYSWWAVPLGAAAYCASPGRELTAPNKTARKIVETRTGVAEAPRDLGRLIE